MDMRRLSKLAGIPYLKENITGDAATDRNISVFLSGVPEDMRIAANDAIEAIYDAGEITVADWAAKVRPLHPTTPIADVLKMVAKGLSNVQRVGPGKFSWNKAGVTGSNDRVPDEPLATPDANDPHEQMIGGMVPLAYEALDTLKELGSATMQQWVMALSRRTGQDPRALVGYVKHLMDHTRLVTKGPDGMLTIPGEEKQDPMDTLRRIVSNPKGK